jgi:hypothetical protein
LRTSSKNEEKLELKGLSHGEAKGRRIAVFFHRTALVRGANVASSIFVGVRWTCIQSFSRIACSSKRVVLCVMEVCTPNPDTKCHGTRIV